MSGKRTEYSIGVIFVIVAAITYSTAGIFTKGVVAAAWSVTFWRGVFAAGFTTGWTIGKGTFRANFLSMGKSGWAVAVIGAVGTAAFIPAFKLTSIANVSLIYAAAPLIAGMLVWVAIGEKITRRTMIGSICALAGVGIIVSGSIGTVNLTGDGLALIMTIAMATIMVIYRMFPKTPSAGPSVMQSLFLIPPSFIFGAPFQTVPTEIAILAAFGLLFAIASVTLAEGAKRVQSGQTALLSALETPLAPLFAFFIFAEMPSTVTLLGGGIVLVAVLLSIKDETPPETILREARNTSMSFEIWLTYLATVLAFMITPGPSHLLMLSNSMTHGFRPSLATAAGDLTANAFQMIAAGLGLAAILIASQNALTVLKWAGVAYLIWMGIRMWLHASDAHSTAGAARSASLRTLWGQGFLTSAANPKAVVFFAALFPQFIDPAKPFAPQFLALSITYLVVDGTFLASYGVSASWLASKLKGRATAIVHRIGSLFLIGAAVMLGLKTLRDTS